MRYGYRCTQGVCPDVEGVEYVRCLLCRSTDTIADAFVSCLVPHLGVEPSCRALEERCLFRLAYEALSMIAHPSNNKDSDLSEPLVLGLCVASSRG